MSSPTPDTLKGKKGLLRLLIIVLIAVPFWDFKSYSDTILWPDEDSNLIVISLFDAFLLVMVLFPWIMAYFLMIGKNRSAVQNTIGLMLIYAGLGAISYTVSLVFYDETDVEVKFTLIAIAVILLYLRISRRVQNTYP
jgi:Cu/Ag efflux pump CusA